MASVTPKVSITQPNGPPVINMPNSPQLRPQFRRQGTSFVSPMAVMPIPSRVDYSVTKGGLRLWVVLFVFIFLCTSLYAIFSTKELSEMNTIDIEEELQNVDTEQDQEDDSEEVFDQSRKLNRDTTTSKLNLPSSKTSNNIKTENGNDGNNDESEEENMENEEELFAKLKAKVEQRSKKKKDVETTADDVKSTNDDDDNDEQEEEIAYEQKKRFKRKKKVVVQTAKDDNDDEGRDEVTEAITPQRSKTAKRVEKKAEPKRKSVGAKANIDKDAIGADEQKFDSEDKDSEIDGDQNNNKKTEASVKEDGINDNEKQKSKMGNKEIDEKVNEGRKKSGDDENGDQNNDEGEDNDEEEPVEVEETSKKSRRSQRFGSGGIKPQECRRKNCPTIDEGKPRKELLKQKSRKTMLRLSKKYKINEAEDDDDETVADDEASDEEPVVDEAEDDEEDEDEQLNASEENEEISAAKYERLQNKKAYKRHAITNREDDRFRTLLDKADSLVEKHEYKTAFALFDRVLEQNEDSPRAHFGKARAYEIRSDSEADGGFIDLAINEYQAVLKNDDSPDALYNQAASRLIERARFRGSLHTVLMAQRALIDRFPDDPELQNDFALTFLMMGREDDAFKVYNDVLKLYPENGMAQAYYGFIQKLRGNFDDAVLFMRKGFRGTQRKITDPRFYYHFGDALMRLGKTQEAYEVYSEGAKIGLFLSPYQRSLHNFRGLSARPWWTIEQTTYAKFLKVLEKQWTVIREEAIILLKTHPEYFVPENPELTLFGNWSAFYFYRGWSWDESNCFKARKTCELLKEFRDTSNSSKSEMKLSLLTSNSRVWPHCGYSNCRLQAHMGLVVPSEARIRVADEVHGWKTGRFIVFDDSFEHELWFEGASANKYCLVLSIDLWHPDVASERRVDLGSL